MSTQKFTTGDRGYYTCVMHLPLIEQNVNMTELGPRATSKTFIHKNLSRFTRIFSGCGISPAVPFYNTQQKILG